MLTQLNRHRFGARSARGTSRGTIATEPVCIQCLLSAVLVASVHAERSGRRSRPLNPRVRGSSPWRRTRSELGKCLLLLALTDEVVERNSFHALVRVTAGITGGR